MPTIQSQLQALKKQIKVPYRIEFVDDVVEPEDFEEKTVYVHIWIKEKS